jgi:uncharacterized alkaline shock family protein YloU
MDEKPPIGKITVDPGVLETIARLTTLAVPGVVRLTSPLGFQRILGIKDGVQIVVQEGTVQVDLHVVVGSDCDILTLSRRIQTEVTRAIEDMVGMEIKTVNVHIEDVAPAPCQEESDR